MDGAIGTTVVIECNLEVVQETPAYEPITGAATVSKIDHNDGALEHVEVRHWDHGIVFGGGHYSTVGCVRGLDLRMDDCKVRIMIRRN